LWSGCFLAHPRRPHRPGRRSERFPQHRGRHRPAGRHRNHRRLRATTLHAALGPRPGGGHLNPRQVRRFAQSVGRDEKTDAIDAGLIAWFAQVRPCPPTPPPAPDQQHRRALVTRLRQLTDTGTAQRNQRRLVTDPSVLILIDQLPALIEHQIHALEQQIAALIAQDPLWRALNSEFRSSKGVATRTVARLMAEMPGIGTLSNKSISKLAGLAPLAQDSGRHQGKRRVRGGRPPVRDILFVVASVAGRCEPDLMAFRQRLAAQGKPPKVIRIALAHKLLVRLNAKARDVRRQLEIFPAAEQLPSNPQCST